MSDIKLEDAGKVAKALRATLDCVEQHGCTNCPAAPYRDYADDHSCDGGTTIYAADLLDALAGKIKQQEDELQYGADAIETLTKDYAKLEAKLAALLIAM